MRSLGKGDVVVWRSLGKSVDVWRSLSKGNVEILGSLWRNGVERDRTGSTSVWFFAIRS